MLSMPSKKIAKWFSHLAIKCWIFRDNQSALLRKGAATQVKSTRLVEMNMESLQMANWCARRIGYLWGCFDWPVREN